MCCCSCDHASRAVYMILFHFAAPNISLFSHTLSPEIPSWLDETDIRRKPCVCVWKKAPSTFLLSVGSLTKSGVFSSLVQYFSRVLCYTNTIQTFLYHAIVFDRFLTEIKGAGYQFEHQHYYKTFFFETKISKHHSFHMTT